MQRGWESEIEVSRSGTEMFGGDYSSQPRPYMGWCSAWVNGWMELLAAACLCDRPHGATRPPLDEFL
jgi:hypothetical protein